MLDGRWQVKAHPAPQGQARRTLAPQIREAVSARALLTRRLFGQILWATDDGELVEDRCRAYNLS